MKKLLLAFTAVAMSTTGMFAQTRLSLYEEFSGENCGPCAAANPGLWTLLQANTSKAILIKYQSPIPSAGPIYNLYTTVTDARLTYYSVPFAPYGRLNGTGLGTGTAAPSSPGHVANLTQTDINNDYAVAAPFNMTATHAWNAAGDSVTTTVNVTCVAAYAPTNANLKLRIALIEHLVYATPPGSNGETDFHNVVREMYPDANGTPISGTWTVGQTQTFTLKGRAPYYVDKNGADTRMVAWIQNDADKSIPQAAVSTPVAVPTDVAATAISTPSSLVCGVNQTVSPVITLKNTGTTTLTSATIYSRVGTTGTWAMQPWTGSLAAGATTTVTLAPLTLSAGSNMIYDSVAMPNGIADVNTGNNAGSAAVTVYDNVNGAALPLTTGFEGGPAAPADWILYDQDADGENWYVASSSSSNVGHANSTWLLYFPSFSFAQGEKDYAILPGTTTTGQRALDFYYAHAQYNSSSNDALDVVYSTDCGATWTSVWGKAGATLSTAAATTDPYVPAQADWKLASVDVSMVPAGSMLALRATSDYGNNIFVDDANYRTGLPTGVKNIVEEASISLLPNPAKDKATLSFNLSQKGKVQVQVVDNIGRVVVTAVNGDLEAGQQTIVINTDNFAAGLYNVVLSTEKGVMNQRLSVVK